VIFRESTIFRDSTPPDSHLKRDFFGVEFSTWKKMKKMISP
jgi:hypothetical protein